jgi:hypothetical protein
MIQIAIGILAAMLFMYRNPHRDLVNVVAFFVFLTFSSAPLINLSLGGFYFWAAAATGLLITYLVRFFRKSRIVFFDILKYLALLAIIIYPLSELSFGGQFQTLDYYLQNLILPFVATIYLYDRLIFTTEMKKRFITILSIQSIALLFMLAFAIYQKTQADLQREAAQKEHDKAMQLRDSLEKLKQQRVGE